MDEEWRALPGYGGLYEVSSIGRVRRLPHTIPIATWTRHLPLKILKQWIGSYEHYCVSLPGSPRAITCRVADLMLQAFVGPAPAPGFEATYKNGDSFNVVIDNLTYGPSENEQRYFNPGNAKIVPKQVQEIRASTESAETIGDKYGITPLNVRLIRKRKSWKDVA